MGGGANDGKKPSWHGCSWGQEEGAMGGATRTCLASLVLSFQKTHAHQPLRRRRRRRRGWGREKPEMENRKWNMVWIPYAHQFPSSRELKQRLFVNAAKRHLPESLPLVVALPSAFRLHLHLRPSPNGLQSAAYSLQPTAHPLLTRTRNQSDPNRSLSWRLPATRHLARSATLGQAIFKVENTF